MKIFRNITILALLLLAGSASARGYKGDNIRKIGQYVVVSLDTTEAHTVYLEPDEVGRRVFNEKLDDLVSSWYVNNIFLSRDVKTDFTLYRHMELSDEVLVSRLQSLEAAVKLSYNSVVRDYIEMYATRKPTQVEIMLGLSAYYFPFFEEIFDKYELPHELKYMAIIESALNPRATSSASAVGLWQFMLGTAKGMGLEVTTFIDERRDVLKATDAAARYLKQLYDVYGDWHLVIAAYNCGPGNVNKAITRAGGKTDYWQIYYALPRETRGYVPAFIAATYVMNYYREHQLTPRYPAMALNTDTIMVNQLINLQQIAANLNLDLEALRDMNPMFRHDIIPGTSEKAYPVRVPTELVSQFIVSADTIYRHDRHLHFPDNTLVTPQMAAVQAGRNGSGSGNGSSKSSSGGGSGGNEDRADSHEGEVRITYTVKSGDNPGYIADWFDITVSELKSWNTLKRNMIRVGQKLTIYVPEDKTDYYKKINNLSFSAKQSLSGKRVPDNAMASAAKPKESAAKESAAKESAPAAGNSKESPAGASGETTASASASSGSKAVQGSASNRETASTASSLASSLSSSLIGASGDFETYTVKKGDNLYTIAKKYPGISGNDLMKLNNITDVKSLRAGQKLKIRPKT